MELPTVFPEASVVTVSLCVKVALYEATVVVAAARVVTVVHTTPLGVEDGPFTMVQMAVVAAPLTEYKTTVGETVHEDVTGAPLAPLAPLAALAPLAPGTGGDDVTVTICAVSVVTARKGLALVVTTPLVDQAVVLPLTEATKTVALGLKTVLDENVHGTTEILILSEAVTITTELVS